MINCFLTNPSAVWTVLATLYFLPVWLLALFANRDLNGRGSWRLAAAALMPGALFMTLTIAAYGLGLLDLVYLGWCFSFHFIIGWIYLLARTPRVNQRPPSGHRATLVAGRRVAGLSVQP